MFTCTQNSSDQTLSMTAATTIDVQGNSFAGYHDAVSDGQFIHVSYFGRFLFVFDM